MLTFDQFTIAQSGPVLTETVINKHSTHVEELIFTNGAKGVDQAIQGLQYIVDTIGKQPPVSTKIDGCVHEDTLVVTTKGPKKISTLTNDDYVMTYDIANDRYVYCNHCQPRITGKSKSWVKVVLNNYGTVLTTSDHQWLTVANKWVPAEKLKRRKVFVVGNKHGMYVNDVIEQPIKYDQWDLTTINHNFVITVNGDRFVIHNSPAVFMVNGNKGFGIASKSIFNKNTKINYTDSDINTNHTGGIVDKLKASLKYLRNIVPSTKNKVWQGDLLFTKDELKTFTHDGKTLIGFQPNTLLYTVEKDSDLGRQIASSDIGIAVHTQYKWDGTDPATIDVEKFGISKDIFKDSKNVFVIDTVSTINNSKKVAFSNDQLTSIDNALSKVKTLKSKVRWEIIEDSGIGSYLQMYINTFIRENVAMIEPQKRAEKFFDWVNETIEKQKATRKTQKGKDAVDGRFAKVVATRSQLNSIVALFEIFDALTTVKLMIIDKLNALSQYGKFVVKANGDIQSVGDEGFVLTDTEAKGVKLVDRYSFSKNNFSKDIIKNWTHKQ